MVLSCGDSFFTILLSQSSDTNDWDFLHTPWHWGTAEPRWHYRRGDLWGGCITGGWGKLRRFLEDSSFLSWKFVEQRSFPGQVWISESIHSHSTETYHSFNSLLLGKLAFSPLSLVPQASQIHKKLRCLHFSLLHTAMGTQVPWKAERKS